MKIHLTDVQIAQLKELHGDDKVSAYLEIAQVIESGAIDPSPTKEEADRIVERMSI
jgi:hypothetical protein